MKPRAEARQDIAGKSFDLCVIGGGATGAACALDAQLRGISTVLLEAGDFAGATSSKATKIIHGGVRYLEEAVKGLDLREYQVVVRALHERVRMLKNAPHLTRKLEFLAPGYRWFDILYLGIGLKLYDWLAGSGRISPSTILSRGETLKRMPGLNGKGLVGSVAYADGQFDDARYNVTLVQTFSEAGGSALNYGRVTGLERGADGNISGVVVTDQLDGSTFHVQAKTVVNATGPFSDSVRQMATPSARRRMRPSKGAHILLPLEVFPTEDALLIPKTADGRVLFAIPWQGRLLVGTTDEEVSVDDELLVTKDDVEYMLRHLGRYLAKAVTPDEVMSGFAGARPLVGADEKGDTKKLARDDVLEVDAASGLISIMGGKWTTHRAMAEGTVDRVQQALGKNKTRCQTRDYVLHGGKDFTGDYWKKLSTRDSLPEDTARHLASKYGTAAEAVLSIAREHATLRQPVVAGYPAIQAEVIYAARHEMAAAIEDVLSRRIGLQLYSWRMAIIAAPVAGALMARELAWSAEFTHLAVSGYVSEINRLLESAGLQREDASSRSDGQRAAN